MFTFVTVILKVLLTSFVTLLRLELALLSLWPCSAYVVALVSMGHTEFSGPAELVSPLGPAERITHVRLHFNFDHTYDTLLPTSQIFSKSNGEGTHRPSGVPVISPKSDDAPEATYRPSGENTTE
jgi:hypothetical protein